MGHVRIMFSKFNDAIAQCIAFDHLAEGDALLTADDFRRQLVHFCSLLSAVAMQSLQHEDNLDVLVDEPQAYGGLLYRRQPRSLTGERRCDAKVEVLGGLTEAEKLLLKNDSDRAHTVNSCALHRRPLCAPPAPRRRRRAVHLSLHLSTPPVPRRPTPTLPRPRETPHAARGAIPVHPLTRHLPLNPSHPHPASPCWSQGSSAASRCGSARAASRCRRRSSRVSTRSSQMRCSGSTRP